jgi:hypothetical protein
MSILNLSKRGSAPPAANPDHGSQRHRSGLSYDLTLVVAAVISVAVIIVGFIACAAYMIHAGATPADRHYQCVDNAGQAVADSECRRPVVPPIVSPVIVP